MASTEKKRKFRKNKALVLDLDAKDETCVSKIANEDISMQENMNSNLSNENTPRSKKEKKILYGVNETAEESLPSTLKKKKRKSKDMQCENVNYSETHFQTDTTPTLKKSKKDKKRDMSENENVASMTDTAEDVAVDTDSLPLKKKKRKLKDIQCDYSVDDSVVSDSQTDASPAVKKRKKDKNREVPENESAVDTTKASDDVTAILKDLDADSLPLKKRKKEKQKKSAKVSTSEETGPIAEQLKVPKNKRALEYLRLWKVKRKAWKFNKMMQTCLLRTMYDQVLVSEEDFETLLLYLAGLQGKTVREKTKEEANAILQGEGEEGSADVIKDDRARQIFQLLS